MSKIQLGARIVLGLIYFVFGLMGLAMAVGLMHPQMPPMPEAATRFNEGLFGSGYFLPELKITETTCGFLLLSGIAAPAALVIIAPVTLNIFLFHLFLTPGVKELPLPLLMVIAQVIAMSGYWDVYRPLFSKKRR
jgi:putative oxidoreductase